MEALQCILGRRSVRQYRSDRLGPDVVRPMLEAARWAPTPANLQLRRFVAVEDGALIGKLGEATLDQPYVARAPFVLVACANFVAARGAVGEIGVSLATQEVAAAVQNVTLAAHAQGLASCWVGLFDAAKVARLLDLPAELTPVALVCVGYPAAAVPVPERLPVEQIFTWRR
jgi:nitroreductase